VESRANEILAGLDRINLFRIAAERAPFAQPVRTNVRFTSGFGNRRDPKTGRTRMHNGVDFAGPRGTAIHATSEGTVITAGWEGGYGNTVVIRHAFGIETLYAHLSSIDVRVGQRVSRGDRIGGMGTTGRSTGVHLHYEVRLGGTPVNPMTYIRAARNVF
jgi:murein DD-endopeptidase MepM/ murein hydrolase activator NlpD